MSITVSSFMMINSFGYCSLLQGAAYVYSNVGTDADLSLFNKH